MCSRPSRSRVCCARGPTTSCGSARVAGSKRASFRRTISRSNGCRSVACAARASRRCSLRRSGSRMRCIRRCASCASIGRSSSSGSVGFVTGPGGVAAWLTRAPLVIHEQNAIAGFTNRRLAPLSREVLEAFPNSFDAGTKARAIGNPVRAEIFAVPPPAQRFAQRSGAIRLLVIGGSLGAMKLNATVPFAVARLAGTIELEVRHQAGETLDRERAQELRRRERARGCAAVHRRHGGSLRVGGSRDLPRRRADDFRAGRRGCWRDPRAVPARGGRPPDSQRAVPRAGRRGRADCTTATSRRAPRRPSCSACAPAAASCSRWPSARACSRSPTQPKISFQSACSNACKECRMTSVGTDRMRRINTIHFVGIGGSGMGGIAEVLHEPRLSRAGLGSQAEQRDDRGSRSWARRSRSATPRRT